MKKRLDIKSPEYRDLINKLTTTKINLPPLNLPLIPTSPLPSRDSHKSSKRRSSLKKSSPKMTLDDIPLPALQEILLKLDRETLNEMCKRNKQAAKICDEKNFQIMYDAKHGNVKMMLVGILKPEKTDIEGYWLFKDENGNYLTFELWEDRIDPYRIRIVYTPRAYSGIDNRINLVLEKTQYEGPVFTIRNPPKGFNDYEKVLKSIGKLRWLKGAGPVEREKYAEIIPLTREAGEEFLKVVKKAVGSQVPDNFFKKTKAIKLV